MNESTILYAGIFCFSMILVGFVLTIREFRQMERSRGKIAKSP